MLAERDRVIVALEAQLKVHIHTRSPHILFPSLLTVLFPYSSPPSLAFDFPSNYSLTMSSFHTYLLTHTHIPDEQMHLAKKEDGNLLVGLEHLSLTAKKEEDSFTQQSVFHQQGPSRQVFTLLHLCIAQGTA